MNISEIINEGGVYGDMELWCHARRRLGSQYVGQLLFGRPMSRDRKGTAIWSPLLLLLLLRSPNFLNSMPKEWRRNVLLYIIDALELPHWP